MAETLSAVAGVVGPSPTVVCAARLLCCGSQIGTLRSYLSTEQDPLHVLVEIDEVAGCVVQ
jgi:hypothetical protein